MILAVPTDEYIKDVYEIRNHPEVRKMMFDDKEFEFNDHLKYLRKKMREFDFHLFVALVDKQVVGYIRLKKDCHYYDLSYAVHPDHQGNAYAFKMIKAVRQMGFSPLQACIKRGNIASIKTIEKFGFIDASDKDSRLFLEMV